MVNDFFKGFLYTLGKILAFLFILLVIGTLLTKINTDDIKVERLPFKQILMNLFFVNGHAQTSSGYFNMYYVKSTNSGSIPQSYTSTLGFNYPTNTYTQLAGSTIVSNPSYHQFSVITQAQFAPTFNFTKGNLYTLTFNFDTGSYVIPYFPTNNSNWFVSSCTNNVCSNQSATTTYTFTIDSTHQSVNTLQLVIKFTASATGSTTITIGNLTDNSGVFYNQYSSQQGIRISSATIDEVEQSVDLSPIIENNNQNTQIIINNQNNNTTQITNSIDDINDTLTDTTISGDSIGSKFADIYLISDTPITDLLTMPLHLLQKIYNSIQNECTPYTLPFDFGFSPLQGYTISLPCLNLGHENRLGRVVWGYVDDLCCIFMIYNIFKMVIYFYDSWTSLKDNFDWLIDPSTRGLPY